MNTLCPVCNGLRSLSSKCMNCQSGILCDDGPVHHYVGPYAPYEMRDPSDDPSVFTCSHVVVCDFCEAYSYIVVKNDII